MPDAGGLDRINTLPKLLDYLREHCEWPIEEEDFDDLVFDWDPRELGLKEASEYANIEIKQLRPLTSNQPWGVFFVNFPKKDLKVTVLRRILGALTVKRRKSANAGERAAWQKHDLLFLSSYGETGHRRLTFAHFQDDPDDSHVVARLDVLGWNPDNTIRRLSQVRDRLTDNLRWPSSGESIEKWRTRWSSAFDERPREAITTSKQLASALANLAIQIRDRAISLLDEETDTGPLTKLYKAFKEALIHDLTPHRFADMYAQTITYGLLATTFRRTSGAVTADSISMMALPTNPFLADTLKDFLQAGGRKGEMDFDELGVSDVVEMLRRANMEAVLRDFDDRNPEQDPVIHFYESFLKEYDPEERIQRGVFYTPRPVVSFIVRSVDEVLRRDFKLEDGLADTATWGEMERRLPDLQRPKGVGASDPFVRILDPATGTGTFLVEVIDLIHTRMIEKWKAARKSEREIDQLWNDYVSKHLLPRLYAFELMMAPYAIAHMKVGLKLFDTGYKFGSKERARIFLANALEAPKDLDMQLAFMSEALAHEARAANDAKGTKFTAVIGNPPYKGHSLNPSKDKKGKLTDAGMLIQHYFKVDGKPLGEKNPKWINNDYVKFLALAEGKLKSTGTGVIGYITSNSWLDSPTFRGVRASILQTFERLWILDLHGHVKKREAALDGSPDEGVFDIEEGTNVTVGAHSCEKSKQVRSEDLYGAREGEQGKFSWLLAKTAYGGILRSLTPKSELYLLCPVTGNSTEYDRFPKITEVMPTNALGFQTHRDHFAIDVTRKRLLERLEQFSSLTGKQLERFCEEQEISANRDWSPSSGRRVLNQAGSVSSVIEKCSYRPFDDRFTVLSEAVMDYPRPAMMIHCRDSIALNVCRQINKVGFKHVLVSLRPPESCLISTGTREGSYAFPLWLKPNGTERRNLPNIGSGFARRLSTLVKLIWDDGVTEGRQGELAPNLRIKRPVQDAMFDERGRGDLEKTFGPRDVFDWIYAVLHSPGYRARYADFLKSDFARIPLPSSKALFQQLVPLGARLAALHLLADNEEKLLKEPKDVRFAGRGAAAVEKGFPKWSNGRVAINAERWFEDVPDNVWNFHIGGYQVCEKWLKDRRIDKLGRPLSEADILHYRRVVTAISETIDLMAEIDRVIDQNGGWPDAFKGMKDEP